MNGVVGPDTPALMCSVMTCSAARPRTPRGPALATDGKITSTINEV